MGTSKKLQTLRYAPSEKCSFTEVNSAFSSVASLDFGDFRSPHILIQAKNIRNCLLFKIFMYFCN